MIPTSTFAIRRFVESDLVDAARIDRTAFPSHESDPQSVNHLAEELVRPWAYLTVATAPAAGNERERILGFLVAWFVADEVHLLNVAVDEAERRRGVGRALVSDLVRAASERASEKVFLEVRTKNAAAVALYQSMGFETLSIRKQYYSDGEDAFDMMLLPTK